MNTLPALTTVRQTAASPQSATVRPAVAPVTPGPVAERVAVVEVPGLPPVGRRFLGELVHAGLLSADALPDFFARVGSRLGQFTTRERTADALVGFHALTRYLATRAIAGQYHGLAFGGYRVLDRLGSGTVGVVFRGEHTTLRRPVAIKAVNLVPELTPGVVARFFREVRLLSQIDHPNVVAVHDAGRLPEAEGQPGMAYFVMDLVPGGDLENRVYEQGTAAVGVAAEWGRQAARALAACHAGGFVHRDVKPSNLLLTATGGVKLIDFGLAREFASTLTGPGTLLGSLEFLAPEQLQDAPTAGEPADVYGLGATLFWVLTGQLPYPQQTRASEVIAAIQAGPPRRLRDLRPDLPPALDALVTRMLARHPGGRPTAAQVAAELGQFTADPATGPADAARHLERTARATGVQLDQARQAVVAALAEAAAARPGESKAHQARIAGTTRSMVARLAATTEWASFTDPRAVAELGRAAMLHDLGLVATPDDAIDATGHRSPSDQYAYEQHPVQGEAVLTALGQLHGDALPFLRVARAAVRHHHERFDGTGFPDGLAGKHIPAAARVVAAAVAYEEYRRTHTPFDAAVMIRAGAKLAFDPAVVEAFVAALPDIEQHYQELADPDLCGYDVAAEPPAN